MKRLQVHRCVAVCRALCRALRCLGATALTRALLQHAAIEESRLSSSLRRRQQRRLVYSAAHSVLGSGRSRHILHPEIRRVRNFHGTYFAALDRLKWPLRSHPCSHSPLIRHARCGLARDACAKPRESKATAALAVSRPSAQHAAAALAFRTPNEIALPRWQLLCIEGGVIVKEGAGVCGPVGRRHSAVGGRGVIAEAEDQVSECCVFAPACKHFDFNAQLFCSRMGARDHANVAAQANELAWLSCRLLPLLFLRQREKMGLRGD